ncbi:MAG: hypothetical protein WCZ16_12600 [Desulfosarcinaceae bacterium]
MSARRVRIVLICEDSQHEAFTRRFLAGMGWNTRELRVEKSPSASGSAEQWVRMKFPDELKIYRQRRQRAASALIAMIDADTQSVQERIQGFKDECNARHIPFRSTDDAAVIAAPKRKGTSRPGFVILKGSRAMKRRPTPSWQDSGSASMRCPAWYSSAIKRDCMKMHRRRYHRPAMSTTPEYGRSFDEEDSAENDMDRL